MDRFSKLIFTVAKESKARKKKKVKKKPLHSRDYGLGFGGDDLFFWRDKKNG